MMNFYSSPDSSSLYGEDLRFDTKVRVLMVRCSHEQVLSPALDQGALVHGLGLHAESEQGVPRPAAHVH